MSLIKWIHFCHATTFFVMKMGIVKKCGELKSVYWKLKRAESVTRVTRTITNLTVPKMLIFLYSLK